MADLETRTENIPKYKMSMDCLVIPKRKEYLLT